MWYHLAKSDIRKNEIECNAEYMECKPNSHVHVAGSQNISYLLFLPFGEIV